jgi:hypothetical protein
MHTIAHAREIAATIFRRPIFSNDQGIDFAKSVVNAATVLGRIRLARVHYGTSVTKTPQHHVAKSRRCRRGKTCIASPLVPPAESGSKNDAHIRDMTKRRQHHAIQEIWT